MLSRTFAAAAVLVVAAFVLVGLFLALADPSGALYRGVVPHTAQLPGIGYLAEAGVLALIGLFAVAAWRVRRGHPARRAAVVTGACGVLVAYAASELLKMFLTEERPCRAELALPVCPEAGDWSFPSNHAVIAFGLATAVTILVPRFAWAALPLAAVVAAGRVLQGVHYPHDVLAGSVLGISVTLAVAVAATPPLGAIVRRRTGSTSRRNAAAARW
ncbi:phosphatase PAP2 family protein [Rhodococcus triatomae]|uniref:Undecaprenyl-diphosphatase n=1 Tax=Rhodococcus triatomae TaxID=300028 RepID=A0A1G8JBS1_9NOCA|nr:phosphatase PAP2 family protein [Rhodococcus triatomae]QNG19760.1 phosphatase PAP2 family protein [Rhodococcus triatomae]QNG24324.1 phosphatase PAP2 family protein [Rhodococcus triatomae]SDI28437.1 undecaprenyl-diphosphatase [Rhodococcus triatomae]